MKLLETAATVNDLASLLADAMYRPRVDDIGYDWQTHGPLDKRFKRSVANLLRNMAEKERNRRRLLPTIAIGNEFRAGGVTPSDIAVRQTPGDEATIEEFPELVQRRLGEY